MTTCHASTVSGFCSTLNDQRPYLFSQHPKANTKTHVFMLEGSANLLLYGQPLANCISTDERSLS